MDESLVVGFCSAEAADYACKNWHYSGTQSSARKVRVGAWEDGKFIGCILFGDATSPFAGNDVRTALGITRDEMTELTRVALTKHRSPVSQIAVRAMALLKEQSPGLRAVISYADPGQGHLGGIYRAMNFGFVGYSGQERAYLDSAGNFVHSRVAEQWKRDGNLRAYDALTKIKQVPKIRYLYGLDKPTWRNIRKISKPYPRGRSVEGDTSAFHAEETGSIPVARSNSIAVHRLCVCGHRRDNHLIVDGEIAKCFVCKTGVKCR